MTEEPERPSRRRAVFAKLLFGYSSTILTVITGIVLVPLYLRYFDLAVYGAWLASLSFVGLVAQLEGGITVVAAQRLAHSYGKGDHELFCGFAGTALLALLGVCGLIVAITLAAAPWICRTFQSPAEHRGALLLAVQLAGIGTGLFLLRNGLGKVADAWQRTAFVGAEAVFSALASLAAVLIGLSQGLGVASLGLGVLVRGISASVGTGAYVTLRWRQLNLPRPQLQRSALRNLSNTILPVFLGRISGSALASSEPLIVGLFFDPESTAILVLSTRVYAVGSLLINPIQGSVYSALSHLVGEGGLDQRRSVVKEVMTAVGLISALLLGGAAALNEPLVNIWVGSAAFAGQSVSLAACLAAIVTTQSGLLVMFAQAHGRLRETGWLGVVDAIVRVGALFAFLPALGLLGIPLSALAATLVTSSLYLFLLWHDLELHGYLRAKLVLPGWLPLVVVLSIAAPLHLVLPTPPNWHRFIVQAILVAAGITALLLTISPAARVAASFLLRRIEQCFATKEPSKSTGGE